MSIRLYVGNLPKEDVERQDLQAIFAEAGDFVSTKVIKDRKTGKCRGFGFVTVNTDEQADQIIEQFNGYMFQDAALKIEKALPRSKGKGDEEFAPGTEDTSSSTEKSNTPPPTRNSERSSGGGSSARRNNKKSRRSPTTASTSYSGSSDEFQPDPRWAADLAKLKEMLATQSSNS
jgi:RNA recognition motif-containing protein